MSLIKEFQDKVAELRETKRQIERSKRLVNIGKITLLGEFYDFAVKPLLVNRQSAFAEYYRRQEEDHRKLLKLWIATEGIETYPVPQSLLERDCPHYSYAALFGYEAGFIGNIADKMTKNGQAENGYARDALQNHDRWLRRRETYPAVHLGHPLLAMEWQLEQKLEKSEWMALIFGEGRTVADFWSDVNNLRDYSRHFPERQHFIGRKPPPRKPHRVSPVFGAGWNPAPSEI